MARPLALTLTVSPLLRAGFSVFGDFAVPACGLIQAAEAGIGRDAAAMGQIIHGVITGIGFIGGGAILKTSNEVRGTATAASLWATALGDGSGRRLWATALGDGGHRRCSGAGQLRHGGGDLRLRRADALRPGPVQIR